jgi:hypothetical protein
MPKKISAKEVLKDIQSGMHDSELMMKYELSPTQFASLKDKMRTAGMLEDSAREKKLSPTDDPYRRRESFSCPACGATQPEEFNECPRCGVVVSKFPPGDPGPSSGPYERGPGTAPPGYADWDDDDRQSRSGLYVVAGISALIVVVGAFLVYRTVLAPQPTEGIRKIVESFRSLPAMEVDWGLMKREFDEEMSRSGDAVRDADPTVYAKLTEIRSLMEEIRQTQLDYQGARDGGMLGMQRSLQQARRIADRAADHRQRMMSGDHTKSDDHTVAGLQRQQQMQTEALNMISPQVQAETAGSRMAEHQQTAESMKQELDYLVDEVLAMMPAP